MAVGVKRYKSSQGLRDDLKSGGGSGYSIQNLPDGGMWVRFLTEASEWVGYREYFDEDNETMVPLGDGESPPDGLRASRRWLANALIVKHPTNDNLVDFAVALKLPVTVVESLLLKEDVYSTLVDRDYVITRMGKGLGTKYDVTPGEKVARSVKKHKLFDLEELLGNELSRVTALLNGDEPPVAKKSAAAKPAQRVGKTAAAPVRGGKPKVVMTLANWGTLADDNDDEAIEKLTDMAQDAELDPDDYPTWAELAAALNSEAVSDDNETEDEDEDEETEDEQEETSEDEEFAEYDEEALLAMGIAELRALADEYSVETKGLNKAKIVQAIIDAAEDSEDEDE